MRKMKTPSDRPPCLMKTSKTMGETIRQMARMIGPPTSYWPCHDPIFVTPNWLSAPPGLTRDILAQAVQPITALRKDAAVSLFEAFLRDRVNHDLTDIQNTSFSATRLFVPSWLPVADQCLRSHAFIAYLLQLRPWTVSPIGWPSGSLSVSTTPQMTCLRGAKVCSKWLQEKCDDKIIQPDNKFIIGLKVRIQFGTLCLRGDVARSRYRHQ